MARLKRPLDPDASAAADDQLYAAHANDPRPNALYDAQGNRLPLDPEDPQQAGLRQEWRELYSQALENKDAQSGSGGKPQPKSPPAASSQGVGEPVQSCPEKHWIEIHLAHAPDISPPDWWPKNKTDGPYPFESFTAEITDGHKEGALDGGGKVRYDCIPEGTCSIQFKQKPPKPGGKGKGAGGSGGPPPPKCPKKVRFKEFQKQKYGWDDHTDNFPWKSVEKGEKDKARAEIMLGGGTASLTNFTSSDTSKVDVSPASASGTKEILTFTGVAKGESEIDAACQGGRLAKMKVKTYVKRSRTVAVRLVHGKGWPNKSTDVSDAAIRGALHKVYKQAVVEFTLTRLPEMTVDFDLNQDGMIDVDSWMSAEMVVVRDACKDDTYDFNIFLVDNPSDGTTGFMSFNQRYGFIHAGNSNNPGQTIAHELGHGQGLPHTVDKAGNDLDPVNLMHTTAEAAPGEFKKWRLRKPQWDTVNP